MFHRVHTPPCLCSATDRMVLRSIVFLVHRVYVLPCLCSRVSIGVVVSVRHGGVGLGLDTLGQG